MRRPAEKLAFYLPIPGFRMRTSACQAACAPVLEQPSWGRCATSLATALLRVAGAPLSRSTCSSMRAVRLLGISGAAVVGSRRVLMGDAS